MNLEIQRYYLEINSIKDLSEIAKPSNIYEVSLINPPDFQLNKFFYKQIGKNYKWIDRLVWSEKKWINYVNNSDVKTFVLKEYVDCDTVDINIRDPFGMNKKDYEECADEVENAIKKLVDKLKEKNMS